MPIDISLWDHNPLNMFSKAKVESERAKLRGGSAGNRPAPCLFRTCGRIGPFEIIIDLER
jgi:hypothetical protein